MLDYECPHCHMRAISMWRAMRFPGQATASISCSQCGTEVEPTWWSVIRTNIPFVAAYLLTWNFISSTFVFIAVVSAALVASLWLSSRFVVWTEKR